MEQRSFLVTCSPTVAAEIDRELEVAFFVRHRG